MPPSPNFRIKALWAFVAVDPEDNSEGIIADLTHPMGPMPMIGADEKRVKSLRPLAQAVADQTGTEIRLVRFDNRVVEEVLNETGSRDANQTVH